MRWREAGREWPSLTCGGKLVALWADSYRRPGVNPRSLRSEELSLELARRLGVRHRFGVFIGRAERDAHARAQRLEKATQTVAVVLAHLMSVAVRPRIPICQMREVLRDEGQVSRARRAAKSQRARVDVRGTGRRDLTNELLEIGRVVGDPGQHRHHVDSDIDTNRTQPGERA